MIAFVGRDYSTLFFLQCINVAERWEAEDHHETRLGKSPQATQEGKSFGQGKRLASGNRFKYSESFTYAKSSDKGNTK
jgi:hypothetical protein